MGRGILEIRSLGVRYGGLAALDNVDMTVQQGTVTGVIGPNGAGKSTLIDAVAGHTRVSNGEILLDGHNVTRISAEARARSGIARTFQVPRFPGDLSVAEVVGLADWFAARRRRGATVPGNAGDAQPRDAGDVLGLCGLSALGRRRCSTLSVPDLRRLELARALACRPAVLFLDEVMAGMGEEGTLQVSDLVRQIAADGVTVVLVEHVMTIVRALCSEVVVLDHGKVIATGKPEDVLRSAAVIESYLGSAAEAR